MAATARFVSAQTHATEKPPNVILIVADDLGYSDLASYGNKFIHTPHIDGLGENGIRFTQAYVTAPICGPSREGLLTGRYQQRYGDEFMPYDHLDPALLKYLRSHYIRMRKTMPGMKNLHPHLFVDREHFNNGLPATETTIAELLKQKGYTTGLVGKWNLGVGEGYFPDQRGYDYSYYFEGALTRYVDDPVDTVLYINQHLPWAFSEPAAWSRRYGSTAIREGRREVKDTGYLTFSLAAKAIEFIEKQKSHPFFLTLTFNAPHDPFQVPKAYFDRITGVKDTVQRVYFGMIEAMDDAVGQVLNKLRETGEDKNTFVIFLSDNGGATYTKATTNAPLRGGKCTHFDGGLQVPFFIKYPDAIRDSKVYAEPVSSLDIFATIAAVTGAALPAGRVYDGVDLVPYVTGIKAGYPHDVFYWRNGYSRAIRKENWKLYSDEKSGRIFLFDLAKDREEMHDLSSLFPAKVKELKEQLKAWENSEFIKPRWRSGADVTIDVDGELFWFPT